MRPWLLLFLPAMAQACDRPVCQIDPASLAFARTITFDDQPSGFGPGRPVDGVAVLPGAQFGERFAGQVTHAEGAFDRLAGTPLPPLAVIATTPHGLGIVRLADTNVLSGYGPAGYPSPAATGEGSIAVLFDRDQTALRFDLRGGEGGNAFVTFLRRDGSFIDTWVIGPLAEATFAFEVLQTNEAIAGFIITNDDPDGIAFDTLSFERSENLS
jgi:hypothetical protein